MTERELQRLIELLGEPGSVGSIRTRSKLLGTAANTLCDLGIRGVVVIGLNENGVMVSTSSKGNDEEAIREWTAALLLQIALIGKPNFEDNTEQEDKEAN